MIGDERVVVVMPAYNAGETLERTFAEVPLDVVDEVVLVDDASSDDTVEVARALGLRHVWRHPENRGYGANQKSCYAHALDLGADVVVMLHPDYQYSPRLIPAMAGIVARGAADVVLGSRILGRGALAGGMPLYKYVANRFLTLVENWLTGQKLSEYHTGYRAFSREVLQGIDLSRNSDDFVFDNQLLLQCLARGATIAEVSCPARYFPEASSIGFARSVRYGLGVLATAVAYRFHVWGLVRSELFAAETVGTRDVVRDAPAG